jgi:hypothetical protein
MAWSWTRRSGKGNPVLPAEIIKIPLAVAQIDLTQTPVIR